jgi:ribosomal protein S27AE
MNFDCNRRRIEIEYTGELNLRRIRCDKCGAVGEFERPNMVTVFDTLGSKVLYCPNCGPTKPESYTALDQ